MNYISIFFKKGNLNIIKFCIDYSWPSVTVDLGPQIQKAGGLSIWAFWYLWVQRRGWGGEGWTQSPVNTTVFSSPILFLQQQNNEVLGEKNELTKATKLVSHWAKFQLWAPGSPFSEFSDSLPAQGVITRSGLKWNFTRECQKQCVSKSMSCRFILISKQNKVPPSYMYVCVGASASALVLTMKIQGWFPLGLIGLLFLLSKGLSGVISSTAIWSINSLALSLLYGPLSHYASQCWDGSASFLRGKAWVPARLFIQWLKRPLLLFSH